MNTPDKKNAEIAAISPKAVCIDIFSELRG